MIVTRFSLPLAALLLLSVSARAEPPANDWTRLEQGDLPGQRWDVPLGYARELNRFLVLGGRTSWGEYRKEPRPYDQLALDTGEAKWLDAPGKGTAAVPARETAYLSEADAVLVGAHVEVDGKLLWPLYDCAKNAWFGVALAGADPVGKGAFNNSMGLMVDPGRELVWAVGQNGHLFVLRLDPKQTKLHPLR